MFQRLVVGVGLLLVLPWVVQGQDRPPPSEGQPQQNLPSWLKDPKQPAPTSAAVTSGPMRVEPAGVLERRISFVGDAPERAPKAELRLVFKLTGERVARVNRVGKLIVEELTDDAGKAIFDPATLTEREKTATNAISNTQGVIQQGYVLLDVMAQPVARTVTKIGKARGYVNIVFGGPEEEITIDNPLQYLGKPLDHPRLKELGVNIRLLKPAEEAVEPADNKGLPIRIEAGDDMVKNIDFYDEWMKRMSVRPRVSKTAKDETYYYYQAMSGALSSDTQLVLTVYKTIDRQKIPFEIKDFPLP